MKSVIWLRRLIFFIEVTELHVQRRASQKYSFFRNIGQSTSPNITNDEIREVVVSSTRPWKKHNDPSLQIILLIVYVTKEETVPLGNKKQRYSVY